MSAPHNTLSNSHRGQDEGFLNQRMCVPGPKFHGPIMVHECLPTVTESALGATRGHEYS